MVAYKQTLSTLEEVVPNSLINDNKIGLSIMENTEQANKGYLLAVKLRARTGTGYSEIISWDEWDYEKRAIGPDSAYISIINYNLSDQGIKVVTLDSNLHYSSKETLENTTILDTNDVEFEIKPNVVMNESSIPTKGPLLVLRDARHYYYLTLERDGKTPVELYKNTDDDEKNVYCYRNINDYEFAKMVMLVFTEGMKKIGELDFDVPYEFGDGTGGFVSAEHEKRVSDKYFYSFNNYAPKLTMITGKESASVRINVPQSICYRNMTTEGSYPKSFDEKDLVTSYLDKWNGDDTIVIHPDGVAKEVKRADRSNIKYSDNLEIVIRMINSLIDIISIALIAFTSLSLVVSTVMIGIITYVSVVERVKEIGIIRSLGGRKKDVAHLFNAETFIIGMGGGLFGLLVTYLLQLMLNLIIGTIFGIGTIANLPILVAILILAGSALLTTIAGLIPASKAAQQDPVVALRTE